MFKDKEKHILRKHYRLNHHLTSNILIPNKNHIIVELGTKRSEEVNWSERGAGKISKEIVTIIHSLFRNLRRVRDISL